MTDQEIIQALEAAARTGAHIAAFDLRKRDVMPTKVRVQLWCADPEHPGQYKSTEFESVIDVVMYETSYQEYLAKMAEVSVPEPDPLDKKEILDDVQHFLDLEHPQTSDDQDPDEAEKGDPE